MRMELGVSSTLMNPRLVVRVGLCELRIRNKALMLRDIQSPFSMQSICLFVFFQLFFSFSFLFTNFFSFTVVQKLSNKIFSLYFPFLVSSVVISVCCLKCSFPSSLVYNRKHRMMEIRYLLSPVTRGNPRTCDYVLEIVLNLYTLQCRFILNLGVCSF